MKDKYFESLLDTFYEGLTTEEQEQELMEYYRAHNSKTSDEEGRFFSALGGALETGPAQNQPCPGMIHGITGQGGKQLRGKFVRRSGNRYLISITSAAAIFIIALITVIAIPKNSSKDTVVIDGHMYTREEIAKNARLIEHALRSVAVTIDKGVESVAYAAERLELSSAQF